jgi:hypothetical protein
MDHRKCNGGRDCTLYRFLIKSGEEKYHDGSEAFLPHCKLCAIDWRIHAETVCKGA